MRTSLTRVGAVRVPAILLLVLSSSSFLFAQPSKSADVAKQLAAALDAAKLEAIAAADPADPTQFVAALYLPGRPDSGRGREVLRANPPGPEDQEKNYRDVYIDLSSASVAGSKVFVIDTGVDGLSAKPGDSGADCPSRVPSSFSSTATGRRRSCRKRST